jgi:hypothetical protein
LDVIAFPLKKVHYAIDNKDNDEYPSPIQYPLMKQKQELEATILIYGKERDRGVVVCTA